MNKLLLVLPFLCFMFNAISMEKEGNKENRAPLIKLRSMKMLPYPSDSADLNTAFCFGDNKSLPMSFEELKEKFIRSRVDTINTLDEDHKCALVHYAAIYGQDGNLFEAIKKKFSNVNLTLPNGDGNIPLILAFFNRNELVFKYLLQEDLPNSYASLVKVYGDLNYTIPMIAATNKVPKVMCNKLLQVIFAKCALDDETKQMPIGSSYKEFLNKQDAYGNTALILAAKNGHKDLFTMLLQQNDIDTTITNNNNKAVCDYVHGSMKRLLNEKK